MYKRNRKGNKNNAQNALEESPPATMHACHTLTQNPSNQSRYQAIFAMKLLGYLLTTNLRPSSNRSNPIPKPMGKNQYSTGTVDVPNTVWNFGTYKKIIAMISANTIAGSKYQLNECCRTDKRRVRRAKRLNHCMTTRLTK